MAITIYGVRDLQTTQLQTSVKMSVTSTGEQVGMHTSAYLILTLSSGMFAINAGAVQTSSFVTEPALVFESSYC